ncbi:hypothetical protein GW17_00038580 [Ensete ventricosum]|nr:hypothetical protein GW17_00038580 [Ensete ventricosum]
MSEPTILAFLSLTQQVQTLTDIMQVITPLLPQLTQSVTPMQQLALEPQTTPLLHEVQPVSLCLTFQGSPQPRRTSDPTLHLLTMELDKVQWSPHDGPDELFPGIIGASTMGCDGSSVPLLWRVISFSTTFSRTSRASARSPLLTGEPDPSLSNLTRPPSPRQCPLEPLLDLHCSQHNRAKLSTSPVSHLNVVEQHPWTSLVLCLDMVRPSHSRVALRPTYTIPSHALSVKP